MQEPQNHLIETLGEGDRRHLLSRCQPVSLNMAQQLEAPGDRLRQVYFPVTGFVSLVAVVDAHPGIEVAMVGREGLLGAAAALDGRTVDFRAVVQGPGRAWRLSRADFRRELARSEGLRSGVRRYLRVLMGQLGCAAGCLCYHAIGPRLARWLLMSQDRARADTFGMTHEFLASMLGVRRAGVTLAAGDLQARGLIAYRRGVITVRDRPGLEAAACSCYAVDRRAHAALLR